MYDFIGNEINEINFKKGDELIILDKNKKEGWLYGYKTCNPQEVGFFPEVFINYLYNEQS